MPAVLTLEFIAQLFSDLSGNETEAGCVDLQAFADAPPRLFLCQPGRQQAAVCVVHQVVPRFPAHHLRGVQAALHFNQIGIQHGIPLGGGEGDHRDPLVDLEIGGPHVLIAPAFQKLHRVFPTLLHAFLRAEIRAVRGQPEDFSALLRHSRLQRHVGQMDGHPPTGNIAAYFRACHRICHPVRADEIPGDLQRFRLRHGLVRKRLSRAVFPRVGEGSVVNQRGIIDRAVVGGACLIAGGVIGRLSCHGLVGHVLAGLCQSAGGIRAGRDQCAEGRRFCFGEGFPLQQIGGIVGQLVGKFHRMLRGGKAQRQQRQTALHLGRAGTDLVQVLRFRAAVGGQKRLAQCHLHILHLPQRGQHRAFIHLPQPRFQPLGSGRYLRRHPCRYSQYNHRSD